MIKFTNVSKTYFDKNGKTTVLKNIDLSINSGEIVAVVGHSGAGKSTLIRLINGLIKPSSGNIYLNNISILNKNLNQIRHQIGMIFQHFNLIYSLNAFNKVLLNLKICDYPKEKRKERVNEVLKLVGLEKKKNSYPVTLSGGEKQRLAIARAIANYPQYLIYDEATSSLDPQTSLEIINLLLEIQQKMAMTVIFITHQIETIKDLAERIIVLDKGEIVEDTSTKNLFINHCHEVTKALLENVLKIPSFAEKEVYQLIYDNNADDTTISKMIKKYQVDINILYAKTIAIKNEIVGYLYLEMTGNNKEEALKYLKNAQVEVKRYVK